MLEDGAERSHPVRIEYGDFGQKVKEVTQLSIDVTADKENLEFTDLVVITDDGFVNAGKDMKTPGLPENCKLNTETYPKLHLIKFCLPQTFPNNDDICVCQNLTVSLPPPVSRRCKV